MHNCILNSDMTMGTVLFCNSYSYTKIIFTKMSISIQKEEHGTTKMSQFTTNGLLSADDEFCTRLKSRVKCTFRSKG